MPEDFEMIDVAEMFIGGQRCYRVTYRKPDGHLHLHDMHAEVFEWRAAEYGLTDLDEIVDVVLHEPFAKEGTEPLEGEEPVSLVNPAPKKTMGKAASAKKPVPLYEAESTAEARDSHRSRITGAKNNVQVVTPKSGVNPLDVWKQHIQISPEGVRRKKEYVDTKRWIKRYGGLPIEPETTPELKEEKGYGN